MRYTFVGKKSPYTGKTLWELVGNLRNFGVGRLFKKCTVDSDPGLSFCKILRVLPLPPNDKPFRDRRVTIWYEEIYKDQKKGIIKRTKNSEVAKYYLIPRMEEEEYLKRAEKLETPVKYVKKYCSWPPLYKKLWELHESNHESKEIPKLKLKISLYEHCKIIEEDKVGPPDTCSLYKSELSVDEMYREVVKLKKLIKSSTAAQQ